MSRSALLVLISIFPLIAGGVRAQTKDDICATVGRTAELIMTLRQNGRPMSDVMAAMQKAGGDNQQVSQILRGLVEAAYSTPVVVNAEDKRKLGTEFRNMSELACYRGTS